MLYTISTNNTSVKYFVDKREMFKQLGTTLYIKATQITPPGYVVSNSSKKGENFFLLRIKLYWEQVEIIRNRTKKGVLLLYMWNVNYC